MGPAPEVEMQPHDERIEIAGGLRLRVLRWDPADGTAGGGDGKSAAPFLLVHGLASNARLWDGVAARLAAAGHLAVAVDLRGHGQSDKPEDGYDFATVARDLGGLVAALGLERPILVGQSWGAGVIVETAIRCPEAARGVVLVDGHLTDLRDGFGSWEECWARLAPPQLVGLPVSRVEHWHRTDHADWPSGSLAGSLANFEIRADGTIAPWLTRERHRLILRSMWDQRIAQTWPKLAVPALIVPVDTGDQGWAAAKRTGAAAAEAALRSSGVPVRIVWFSGDHDVHAQHPAELATLMLEACRDGFFAGKGAA
jgi:pimeloyl-ACP methyl ester carboxylesterase